MHCPHTLSNGLAVDKSLQMQEIWISLKNLGNAENRTRPASERRERYLCAMPTPPTLSKFAVSGGPDYKDSFICFKVNLVAPSTWFL